MNAATSIRSVAAHDARRASLAYHFRDGTIEDVFERHVSVQFDPLSPLGTSHDLTFAARVPHYRLGAWHDAVHGRRLAYDGWDKQASLIDVERQPARRMYHVWHGRRWMEALETSWSDEIAGVLDQLTDRGPLEASEIDLHVRIEAWNGSWYGPRLAKRIVRALWHAGRIATARRRHGRHVYDLAERVLPAEILSRPTPEPDAAVRDLILDRHRATGVLRPGASSEVWSMPVPAAERRRAIDDLVQQGHLVRIDVDGRTYHAVPAWMETLEEGRGCDGVRFVAPLDPLVWDRSGLRYLFEFDYLWEVYKPAARRRWGWYVLPVVHRDRFVGRIEGVREQKAGERPVWRVHRWWWEDAAAPLHGSDPFARFAEDLERAAARFAHYLGVDRCVIRGGVPRDVASVLRSGARQGATVTGAVS